MPEKSQDGNDTQTTNQQGGSQQDAAERETQKTPPDPAQRRRNAFIGIIVAFVLIACALGWWLHSRTYESTDDAQVDGHLNPIAARVDGTLKAVYVEDNQRVHAGQPLADLDTRDAEVSLTQAQADYDQAVSQLNSELPNVSIQKSSNQSDVSSARLEVLTDEAALQGAEHDYDSDVAKLEQAEATNQKAQSDLVRYKQLVDKRELAQADYDQYLSTARADAASVNAAMATAASQKKSIEQRRAQLREQEAKAKQTEENAPRQVMIKNANNGMRAASVKSYGAKLEQAKLNLAYCHIVAPVDGIILQRSGEVGGGISTGQQIMMIAQVDDAWVVANFKETQVRKMRPGQSVDISVDALSKTFSGTVEAMPAATGDRASTLPSQNATGNYVKVIQRLPVRVRFKKDQAGLDELRPGMSVEPKVHLD